MLLREKSMPRMSVKVAMMLAGMATAAIRTARQLRMKRKTMALAKNAAEDEVFEERVDGSFDEVGDVVNDQKLYAGRKLGAEFVELGFYVVGDLDGVGAGLTEDFEC